MLAFQKRHIPPDRRRVARERRRERKDRHRSAVDLLQKPDASGRNHFQEVSRILERQGQPWLRVLPAIQSSSIRSHADEKAIDRLDADADSPDTARFRRSRGTCGLPLRNAFRCFHTIQTQWIPLFQDSAGDGTRFRLSHQELGLPRKPLSPVWHHTFQRFVADRVGRPSTHTETVGEGVEMRMQSFWVIWPGNLERGPGGCRALYPSYHSSAV
jgi:hypothetical protein